MINRLVIIYKLLQHCIAIKKIFNEYSFKDLVGYNDFVKKELLEIKPKYIYKIIKIIYLFMGQKSCLMLAIACSTFLNKYFIENTIIIGVKNDSYDRFHSHAWVNVKNMLLNDIYSFNTYKEIIRI